MRCWRMSQMGQKRNWPSLNGMSVLAPRADLLRVRRHVSKVPTPEVKENLLDHIVGAGNQRGRNAKAESVCSLQIDDQLDLRRLLHRQLTRLGPIQNPNIAKLVRVENVGSRCSI